GHGESQGRRPHRARQTPARHRPRAEGEEGDPRPVRRILLDGRPSRRGGPARHHGRATIRATDRPQGARDDVISGTRGELADEVEYYVQTPRRVQLSKDSGVALADIAQASGHEVAAITKTTGELLEYASGCDWL